MENPNTGSLARQLADRGMSDEDIMLTFRGFSAYAESFRKESDAHEQ
jgi:hypothetical protein